MRQKFEVTGRIQKISEAKQIQTRERGTQLVGHLILEREGLPILFINIWNQYNQIVAEIGERALVKIGFGITSKISDNGVYSTNLYLYEIERID